MDLELLIQISNDSIWKSYLLKYVCPFPLNHWLSSYFVIYIYIYLTIVPKLFFLLMYHIHYNFRLLWPVMFYILRVLYLLSTFSPIILLDPNRDFMFTERFKLAYIGIYGIGCHHNTTWDSLVSGISGRIGFYGLYQDHGQYLDHIYLKLQPQNWL